jgi:hypothetical protein
MRVSVLSAVAAGMILLCLCIPDGLSSTQPPPRPLVGYVRSVACVEPGTSVPFTPLGLAFGLTGELYLVDSDNSRIFRLSESLNAIAYFAECEDSFDDCRMADIEVDDAGWVHVSEQTHGEVMIYDRLGYFVSSVEAGPGLAGFGLDGSGRIFGALGATGAISITSGEGQSEATERISGEGTGNAYPVDCAVWGRQRVLVTDGPSRKVRVLSQLGEEMGTLRGFGFGSPFGVATLPGQWIMVTDSDLGEIAVFDWEGNFLESFGAGRLEMPTFIDIRDDGTVCVSDSRRMTIEVFRIEEQLDD